MRDALGRVASEFSPDKVGRTFEFDAISCVTRVTCGDGAEEFFKYDLYGRLSSATNTSGTVSLTRDSRGRVVREAFDNEWVETTWGSTGRLAQLRTSMGATENIRRDVMGDVLEASCDSH